MQTRTFYRILTAFKKTAEPVGVPINQVVLSQREISAISGVSRVTVRAAVKEAGGFIELPRGIRITKKFNWADLKKHHEQKTNTDLLLGWWEKLPEYKEGEAIDPAPVGPKVTDKEQEFLENFRALPKQNRELITGAVQKLADHWKAGRNREPSMAEIKQMFDSKIGLVFNDHDYKQIQILFILSVLAHQATN